MKEYNNQSFITRRRFIGSAAAVAAISIIPGRLTGSIFKSGIPNTTFNGVRIGVIAPFSFKGLPDTADDILGYLLRLGMTSVEMQSAAFEQYAGAPPAPSRSQPGPPPAGQPNTGQPPAGIPPAGGFQRVPLTPEQQAVQDKYTADIKAWRTSVSMTKYEELRKKYEDAGVMINLAKFDTFTSSMEPGEIDYCFAAAKALGAKAITTGMSDDTKAKLLGPYADKHKFWVGLHNQNQITPETFDIMLSYGKYLGLNFDLGHHTAASEIPLITIIEKYNDRIVSLHLTDRKKNSGPSMPFGQGDTPIKEVLQFCSKKKYPFGADIDLEYQPTQGDSIDELARCIQFCKEALK